jgi:hypothetical protein
MHESVGNARHFAFRNFFADLHQFFLLLFGPVPSPIGKIQSLSSSIYVRNKQPGSRGHVGISRPHGLVGVAVVAGALQHLCHPDGNCKIRMYFACWIILWIRFGGPKNLNHRQDHQEHNTGRFNQTNIAYLLPGPQRAGPLMI